MSPWMLAVAAGGLAISGFAAVYAISALGGQVEWCIPHLHGCTSISRAGRQLPALYVYRATIFPSALLMLAYWWLVYRWLERMDSARPALSKLICALGMVASLSLSLFALCLGSTEEGMRLVRQSGAALFFAGTGLAQVLLTERVLRLSRESAAPFPAGILIAKVVLSAGLVVYCLANLAATLYGIRTLQNAIEWQVATFMALYFILTASLWRRLGEAR